MRSTTRPGNTGPGGYPAAIRAAQLGARTAIVERDALGGTCLNWGCIPTKSLIAGANAVAGAAAASEFGVTTGKISFDYAAMIKRKNEVVAGLRGGVEQLLKANQVTRLNGTAAFVSRHCLAVQSRARTDMIQADRVIIASGSESAMPRFVPRHARVVESRRFLELRPFRRPLQTS